MSISSYPSGFRGGAAIKGVPLFDHITGNVFHVDSGSGAAGNPGTFTRPLATIQQGIDKCTASNGDIVFVFPGHAETVAASINANNAGVAVIGLGTGNLRPTITPNGVIDAIDVSAANVTLANLIFEVPGTDAQTADVNVNAAGCNLLGLVHRGSTGAANKVSFVTVTANGDDCLIDGMRGFNDTVDMVSGIEIGAASRVEIMNSTILSTTIGYSTAVVDDTAVCTDLYIHDCTFKNVKALTAVVSFASNSTGVMSKCFCSGRHTTIASNVVTGTGMDFHENYVVEEPSLNGLYIPIQDAEV